MELSPYFALRIRQINQTLVDTCADFAVAEDRRSYLYSQLEPIIKSQKEICIAQTDCMNMFDYADTMNLLIAITAQQFYKSGFYDCLDLMRELKT